MSLSKIDPECLKDCRNINANTVINFPNSFIDYLNLSYKNNYFAEMKITDELDKETATTRILLLDFALELDNENFIEQISREIGLHNQDYREILNFCTKHELISLIGKEDEIVMFIFYHLDIDLIPSSLLTKQEFLEQWIMYNASVKQIKIENLDSVKKEFPELEKLLKYNNLTLEEKDFENVSVKVYSFEEEVNFKIWKIGKDIRLSDLSYNLYLKYGKDFYSLYDDDDPVSTIKYADGQPLYRYDNDGKVFHNRNDIVEETSRDPKLIVSFSFS